MKKILYISNIAGSKASVNFFGTALRAAKRLGMDFYVVANRSASTPKQIAVDEKEYGVHLLHADISRSPLSLSNIKAYKQICEVIRKYDIDYIHCNTPVGGVLGRLVGKQCKVKKVLYQAHGFHFYKGASKKNWILYYTIEKWLAHYTDAIITMNNEDYDAAKHFKLRNAGSVYKVHGVGINVSEYENIVVNRRQKRFELGLKDSDIVCISAGDLIERKNYEIIIKAIAKINNNKLHYIICGEGPLKNKLIKLAKELRIEDKIHFLGYRNDLNDLMKMSDIFILSSYQEGLPRSLMEAMASGLPCVVSKIRGNVDLIEERKGGILCKSDDVNEFSNAIQLLTNDKKICEKMKKYNLIAIQEYDISKVEKEIRKIYEKILE